MTDIPHDPHGLDPLTELPHELHGLDPQQSVTDWLIVMVGTGVALLAVGLWPHLWG